MNAKDAIRQSMNLSFHVLKTYIADMEDGDLFDRPGPGSNHLAWQLGHLISSEVGLLNGICPGKGAELPAGFAEQHSKEKIGVDDPVQFRTKQEYLELFEKVRVTTLAALDEIPDADLDGPSPEWIRKLLPTVGGMFTLISTHPMMHAGQFAVTRRKLGKPVVI